MRYQHYVLIAAGLFVSGIVIGLIVSALMPPDIVRLFSEEIAALEDFTATLEPFRVSTAAFIYIKNASVLLFSFMFSPLLCLLPVLTLVFNGSLLSFVSVLVIRETSTGYLLAGILPHGIIEVPSIIIGEAAALSFGVATIAVLFTKKEGYQLLPNFKRNLKYLLLAFILLVPAAIVETYITPLFLQ